MSDNVEGAEASTFTINAPRMPAEPDACIPRFYMHPKRDGAKSRSLGREVFRDVEFVEIMVPGNRLSVHVAEVEDKHRQRWPAEYERFKNGQEMAQEGTPLEAWAYLNPSRVQELKSVKIFTVESLSQIADQNLHNLRHIPEIRKLRDMAVDWLAMAEDDAALYELRHKVAQLETERDNDKETIAKLERALTAARETPVVDGPSMQTAPAAVAEPEDEPEPAPDSLSTAMAARKKGKRKRK